jgi:hypothetical protein
MIAVFLGLDVGIKSVNVSPAKVDYAGLGQVRVEGDDPDGGTGSSDVHVPAIGSPPCGSHRLWAHTSATQW